MLKTEDGVVTTVLLIWQLLYLLTYLLTYLLNGACCWQTLVTAGLSVMNNCQSSMQTRRSWISGLILTVIWSVTWETPIVFQVVKLIIFMSCLIKGKGITNYSTWWNVEVFQTSTSSSSVSRRTSDIWCHFSLATKVIDSTILISCTAAFWCF